MTAPLDTVVLEGTLVTLIPLERSHFEDLWLIASGDRSTFSYTWVPETKEALHAYLDEAFEEYEAGEALPFTQVRRSDGRIVGTTRLKELIAWEWPPGHPEQREGPDVTEIGRTWLDPCAQGTGINADAKLSLMTYAFEHLMVRRVSIETDERNIASQRAIEALGVKLDGTLRAHRVGSDATVRDTRFYSIIAAEWPQAKAALQARVQRYVENAQR